MINKFIHIVHRFFPFLFSAFCVIAVVISPFKTLADSTFYIHTHDLGGSAVDTIQAVNGTDLDSSGNFLVSHGAALFKIDHITGSDVYADSSYINSTYSWGSGSGTHYYQPGPGFGGGPVYNLADELNASGTPMSQTWTPAPAGNYMLAFQGGNSVSATSYCFFSWSGSTVDVSHCGTPPVIDTCDSGDTRICGFTPENNAVLTGPNITFTLDSWLAAQDLGVGDRVVIRLHNIDQNVLLLGSLSPNDKLLLDRKFVPGDEGHFSFSTTTTLADGNYRIEAWLEKTVFFGFIKNPFDSSADQVISKQFIVGSSTFIGNLSQNGFNILSGTLGANSATSSVALVAQCNPVGNFNMVNCLAGLFIPDSGQVSATIQGMRDGILTRLPWGYFTRFAVILTSTATTTLPSFTAEVAQNTASDTTTLSFDPGDMLAGGGALVDSIRDPYNGKNIRDIFQPIVQLTVALLVLFEIASDLTGSHKHVGASSPGDTASKRRRV